MVLSDRSLSYLRLPLELWLGRALNPYLKGIIVAEVLSRPNELVLPPQKYFWNEDEETFLEYTLYHNWLKKWLEWVKWYALMSSDPNPRLEDLFNPPMVPITWKRTLRDNDIVRYGLLWKCWDLGDGWSIRTPLFSSLGGTTTERHSLLLW